MSGKTIRALVPDENGAVILVSSGEAHCNGCIADDDNELCSVIDCGTTGALAQPTAQTVLVQWIPVEARMPLTEADLVNCHYATKVVLVTDVDGDVAPRTFCAGNTLDFWADWGKYDANPLIPVAWAELPKPYRIAAPVERVKPKKTMAQALDGEEE